MSRLEKFENQVTRVIVIASVVCGYGLVALSIGICTEVLARRFFDYSLQGVDEYGGYVVAIVASVGFAFALLNNDHTRIDILIGRLPPVVRSAFEITSYGLLAVLAIFLAYRAFVEFSVSLTLGSRASTPLGTELWAPQFLWFVGLLVFVAAALIRLLKLVLATGAFRWRKNRELNQRANDE